MNERVKKLRQQSLDAIPTITAERAQLLTEFYASENGFSSIPVQRAKAFAYILENKSIPILEGELIVGERGPAPKATPTYPEICCHTIQDLDTLDTRPLTSYKVDSQTKQIYQDEIIPFWTEKAMRPKLLSEMTPEWIAAFESGIFTEFMEQRAPGHTVLDGKIYKTGMLDFKADIKASLEGLDYYNDARAFDKAEELKAMDICANALIRFAERHVENALERAQNESNPARKAELEEIARDGHAWRVFVHR